MTDVILNGCFGKMGKAVTAFCEGLDNVRIVAGIDAFNSFPAEFPVYSSPDELNVKADVIIDFSHPLAIEGLLKYAIESKTPCVVSTTGLEEEQILFVKNAAESIPVFFSANMALGVSLVCSLAQRAAKVLGSDFDIEIVETHHNQKIDSPSGTALMIANAVNEVFETPLSFEYDRHSKREKRTKNEIGIHSIRGGTAAGTHEIIFAGYNETIKISHSAQSKEIFASGAVNAARFIIGRKAGLYTMNDLVAE